MRFNRFAFLFAAFGSLLALLVYAADKDKPESASKTRPNTAAKVEPKAAPAKKADKEAEAAVAESAARFVAAYNRHDAKALAAEFTSTAEFVDEDGTVIRGQEAIQRHFAAVFAELPEATLKLHVETTRLVTSNVAIEEGRVELVSHSGAALERSRYVAVHLFQDGQWRLARTHDYSADAEPLSNHDRLHELEWLIGEWVEEEEGVFVATSCKWSSDKSYLLQDFTIRLGNEPSRSGSTRIGWDPQTQQIKSWTFDSDGGYSEALWSRGEKKWVLKSRGVTHSGRNFSRTAILRQTDKGTMSWETHDRVEGGVLLPDQPILIVKRRPPPPGD